MWLGLARLSCLDLAQSWLGLGTIFSEWIHQSKHIALSNASIHLALLFLKFVEVTRDALNSEFKKDLPI